MQTLIVIPNEYLIVEGQIGKEMYFARTGLLTLTIKSNNEENDICRVMPGAYVGEMGYFGHASPYSIRGYSYSHVERLGFSTFKRFAPIPFVLK